MPRRRRVVPDPPPPPSAGVPVLFPPEVFAPLIEQVVLKTLERWQQEEGRVPARLTFSEPEAAEVLGMSLDQLKGERRAGRIAAIPSGSRRVRYSREALLAYARSRPGAR